MHLMGISLNSQHFALPPGRCFRITNNITTNCPNTHLITHNAKWISWLYFIKRKRRDNNGKTHLEFGLYSLNRAHIALIKETIIIFAVDSIMFSMLSWKWLYKYLVLCSNVIYYFYCISCQVIKDWDVLSLCVWQNAQGRGGCTVFCYKVNMPDEKMFNWGRP